MLRRTAAVAFAAAIGGWALIYSLGQVVTINRVCSQGRLVVIREMFADRSTPRETLSICDTESPQTARASLPYELSKSFPGCLVWRGTESGGHAMIRKSNAVCAVPGSTDFICDDAKARHFTESYSIADSVYAVKPCSNDTLRKFGLGS